MIFVVKLLVTFAKFCLRKTSFHLDVFTFFFFFFFFLTQQLTLLSQCRDNFCSSFSLRGNWEEGRKNRDADYEP